ncbi:DUF3617 domain-containing protein [Sphingomonas oryzagri]|jgi:hypothetical protein|uniref:DUF3617 domain-containing protein n=1 Tax=Sphingomonas oryzagri TaxID=3042314 RepID=A0ABT6N767_9SPHN|nr:DUF3617 domain-containing protein [Sphingomonas oryzagri]MDH7640950.1 DUF3617 domain-containing protein [Sphingomonas oryzagri]
MRSIAPITIVALLALAACNKPGSDSVSMKNASLEDVAKTQKAKIQPGEWEVTVEMVDQKITGGPANMPTPPRLPPQTMKTCITPEQVNRPEGMFSGGMDGLKKNCTYDSFSMADGKIDAKMHCAMPSGMKIEATNTGTFSPTEISSDSNSTVTGLPGGMTSSSHTRMSAKRVGECAAGAAPAAVSNAAG